MSMDFLSQNVGKESEFKSSCSGYDSSESLINSPKVCRSYQKKAS